jgi:hypothetical protein
LPNSSLRWTGWTEAQTYLDRWEERWADTPIHGTTKRQVAAMFAEEKPSLLPLPLEPFRYYQYGERREGVIVADTRLVDERLAIEFGHTRELERQQINSRTDLRLLPSVSKNSRVRRYVPLSGSRTSGPDP